MNCSVVRETPVTPPVRSVVLTLTLEEAVELQWTITSGRSSYVKDHVWDVLTETFRAEKIEGGIFV